MRLIDDWLFITADLQKAVRFYDMVSKGARPQPLLRLHAEALDCRPSRVWVLHIQGQESPEL